MRHWLWILRRWAVARGHDIKRWYIAYRWRAAKDALLLLVVLQIAFLGANWINVGRPIIGLRLEGHVVGEFSGSNFQEQIDTIIYNHENRGLSVQVADHTSAITLRQLGVNIDRKQMYAAILAEGRSGDILTRVSDQNLAALGTLNMKLDNGNFNVDLAKAYIATLDQVVDVAPTNAYFAVESQKIIVQSDKPGKVVDVEAAVGELREARPESGKQITLPTKQVPATVTAHMLNPLLPEVKAIAQKPLTIVAGESRTVVSPEQLVALVVPKITPNPTDSAKATIQLTFDETKLNAIVDEVVSRAVVAPQPTIMNGSRVVRQGTNGVGTEDGHSVARVLTALIQRQTGVEALDEARIPLVTLNPPVIQQAVNNPRTRTGTGSVRLTFDDGPGGYSEQVLNILGRYNVHASFYVIGRNVRSYPATMQRIEAEGHRICNHSYTHANLARLSASGVSKELSDTQAAVQEMAGVTPNCFRPPYGAHNQTVRSAAAALGMTVDMWSIDTRDWARPGSGVITRRVLDNTHSGAVVLLHTLNQQTVDALPAIIEGIRAQGYTLE